MNFSLNFSFYLELKYSNFVDCESFFESTLVFIDFKKAFDSIHRGKMLKILRAYGVPEQLVSAIGLYYTQVQKLKFYHQMGRQRFLNFLLESCKETHLLPTFSQS